MGKCSIAFIQMRSWNSAPISFLVFALRGLPFGLGNFSTHRIVQQLSLVQRAVLIALHIEERGLNRCIHGRKSIVIVPFLAEKPA